MGGGLPPCGWGSDLIGDSICKTLGAKNFARLCDPELVHSNRGNRKHPAVADGPKLVSQCAERDGTLEVHLPAGWREAWCPHLDSHTPGGDQTLFSI